MLISSKGPCSRQDTVKAYGQVAEMSVVVDLVHPLPCEGLVTPLLQSS